MLRPPSPYAPVRLEFEIRIWGFRSGGEVHIRGGSGSPDEAGGFSWNFVRSYAMAECSFARCQQERRAIRKELQRWTKNMVYILGE
ncbi:Mushroom body large-type Kenyon cell-specific protein 1 [Papilio xuthus]|uniref:Mushroom body large-type Kenyon cell-specific protein 1 n=2 Tax=Papilio TaxID=7145 RepID=A0A194QI29_PAPXU|nr:Mushroom body large-type Kenyon cell-specific protein 1 [Papilio xuthus]